MTTKCKIFKGFSTDDLEKSINNFLVEKKGKIAYSYGSFKYQAISDSDYTCMFIYEE